MTTGAVQFGKLLKKELESYKIVTLFLAVAVIVWDVFLWTRMTRWHPGLTLGLMFLPVTLIAFWSFLSAILRLRQEWDGNHVHLILPLPVRGWYITGAKVLATLLEIAFLTLLVAGCAAILGKTPFVELVGGFPVGYSNVDVAHMAFQALVVFWLSLCIITVLVQFAYISGRLYDRFSGLITVWVLFLSAWVTARFGTLVEPALRWMPDFKGKSFSITNDYVSMETVTISSAPFASVFLGALVLFAVGSWFLEKHIEI